MLGVHAYATASWLVNGLLCVAVGLGVALVSASNELDPQGTGIAGSLLLGASVAGVGLVGLGVGAVAGQVASTSRGANALASAVIIGFYVLRMIGDLGNGALTWASPIGWGQQMQPYGGNRWWPLVLLVALAAALLAVAARIEAAAITAPGCSPTGRVPPTRRPVWPRRSGSGCACSAGRSSAGRSPSSWPRCCSARSSTR